jgi:predicted nucleic acid-binding protein
MRLPVFVDTSYILALVNRSDALHQRARDTSLRVPPPYLTTEAVLTEVGNALARQRWRSLAITTLRTFRTSTDVEVLSVNAGLFDRAVSFYSARPDKDWGLTDCVSFVVMQERGLTHVLAFDRHFEQAGFQNLL